MPTRASAEGIPKHLRIHVSMAVDEAGSDNTSAGVDYFPGTIVDFTDHGDAVPCNAYIGFESRQPGAVNHCPAANDQIVGHLDFSRM
jgi:hypothetical protein